MWSEDSAVDVLVGLHCTYTHLTLGNPLPLALSKFDFWPEQCTLSKYYSCS